MRVSCGPHFHHLLKEKKRGKKGFIHVEMFGYIMKLNRFT